MPEESSQGSRDDLIAFRVNPEERRTVRLLARLEGKNQSELIRGLVKEKARREAEIPTR